MKPTGKLHEAGQSLWLDNVTRELLNSGTLQYYIDDFSVTGLTSNPTIFDHAIRNSAAYDGDISRNVSSAKSREDLFFQLALADLIRAAELFQPENVQIDGAGADGASARQRDARAAATGDKRAQHKA